MKFEVLWMADAEAELASLWLVAADRKAFTQSATRLERLLRNSPATSGELVFDTVRQLTVSPIAVEYEVLEDDTRVVVFSVWDVDTGPPEPIYN